MSRYLFLLFALVSSVTQAQQQLSPQLTAAVRAVLPEIENEEDAYVLKIDPTTVFYTSSELPRAYQHAAENGAAPTFFLNPMWNISGDDDPVFHSSRRPHGQGGNANIAFPWRVDTPGGTHRCNNLVACKAFWLPKNEQQKAWPVITFSQRLPNPISGAGFDPATGWIFPIGTRFYEILGQRAPNGYTYIFEVRKRQRTATTWEVDIYRPFPKATDLADRLEAYGRSDTATLVSHLRNPNTTETKTLSDVENRNKKAITSTAGVDSLPAIPEDLAAELLNTTSFKSSLGATWKPGSDRNAPTFAPTWEGSSLHIVPTNYDGTFLGTDNESCMKCHDSTNVHARVFDRGRGWYGYVSGSDGIISWHPHDPRRIGRSTPAGGRGVSVRSEFREVVEPYDPRRHPAEVYQQIPGIR